MPPSGRPKPAPTAPKKPDTDGDGLTDEEERRLGTNPRLKDTDFDGVMDKAEVRLNTDPQDWDSDDDGQGDGLEIAIGRTDPSWYDRRFPVEVSDAERQPTPADPDGDRLDATNEQRFGTKADDPDSDGDGLGDWVELVSHSNPNSPYSQGANDKTDGSRRRRARARSHSAGSHRQPRGRAGHLSPRRRPHDLGSGRTPSRCRARDAARTGRVPVRLRSRRRNRAARCSRRGRHVVRIRILRSNNGHPEDRRDRSASGEAARSVRALEPHAGRPGGATPRGLRRAHGRRRPGRRVGAWRSCEGACARQRTARSGQGSEHDGEGLRREGRQGYGVGRTVREGDGRRPPRASTTVASRRDQ